MPASSGIPYNLSECHDHYIDLLFIEYFYSKIFLCFTSMFLLAVQNNNIKARKLYKSKLDDK